MRPTSFTVDATVQYVIEIRYIALHITDAGDHTHHPYFAVFYLFCPV
jgi:hypothetical protein